MMSVMCEFIDFIVPIKTIKEKYPGGWEQCLKDHDYSIGRCIWYDEHLFRTGAMNGMDIDRLLREWESKGFTTFGYQNGVETRWVDVCVYEQFFGGATLQCDWIDWDRESGGVYLKGTDPGELVTRHSFIPTDKLPDWIFQ
jgi:ribosome modulation factor